MTIDPETGRQTRFLPELPEPLLFSSVKYNVALRQIGSV